MVETKRELARQLVGSILNGGKEYYEKVRDIFTPTTTLYWNNDICKWSYTAIQCLYEDEKEVTPEAVYEWLKYYRDYACDGYYKWLRAFKDCHKSLDEVWRIAFFLRYGVEPDEPENKKQNAENTTETKRETPDYYGWLKEKCGVEPIEILQHFDFNRGNALKYIIRAGRKAEGGDRVAVEIKDLKKAVDYLNAEIELLQKQSN